MIGFCKKYDKTVISEADCVFCDSVDLTCCRYWREYEEAEPIKNLKNYIVKSVERCIIILTLRIKAEDILNKNKII